MILIEQIVNITSVPEKKDTSWVLTFLPILSFAFLIITFVFDRALANKVKNKQIIREWYSKALLDPCLINCNQFFINIKNLTHKHLVLFEQNQATLSLADFLKYKGKINDEFERLKIPFYNENLIPIYQNYPSIADNSNNVLLRLQDNFIVLFGGNKIDSDSYDLFINNLYVEKGKLLAILEHPLSTKGKSKLKIS